MAGLWLVILQHFFRYLVQDALHYLSNHLLQPMFCAAAFFSNTEGEEPVATTQGSALGDDDERRFG